VRPGSCKVSASAIANFHTLLGFSLVDAEVQKYGRRWNCEALHTPIDVYVTDAIKQQALAGRKASRCEHVAAKAVWIIFNQPLPSILQLLSRIRITPLVAYLLAEEIAKARTWPL
jgi:hypothetical protein